MNKHKSPDPSKISKLTRFENSRINDRLDEIYHANRCYGNRQFRHGEAVHEFEKRTADLKIDMQGKTTGAPYQPTLDDLAAISKAREVEQMIVKAYKIPSVFNDKGEVIIGSYTHFLWIDLKKSVPNEVDRDTLHKMLEVVRVLDPRKGLYRRSLTEKGSLDSMVAIHKHNFFNDQDRQDPRWLQYGPNENFHSIIESRKGIVSEPIRHRITSYVREKIQAVKAYCSKRISHDSTQGKIAA
jgi:hypothetical protein